MLDDVLKRISWLGHDAFRIDGTPTIYFDPWKIKTPVPADVILISHEHFDHFSKEDVERIVKPDTVIVSMPAVVSQLKGDLRPVKPGDKLEAKGIEIEVVAAYNINKFRAPGQPFHPKQDAKLGFVVTVDGVRLYHAGDTDFIPEMSSFKADIALLPVSGHYVMTSDEAVQAATAVEAKVVIPMHYGEIVGSVADAEAFKRSAKVETHILTRE